MKTMSLLICQLFSYGKEHLKMPQLFCVAIKINTPKDTRAFLYSPGTLGLLPLRGQPWHTGPPASSWAALAQWASHLAMGKVS